MPLHTLRRGRRFSIGDYSTVSSDVVLSGLVNQWKWNGNGVDNISGYTATLFSSPTFTSGSDGKPNHAISFIPPAYAYVQDIATNGWIACSISFWFYMISIPQIYTRLIEKGNNNEITIATGYGSLSNNSITLQTLGSTLPFLQSSAYTYNAWHHCVVTIGPNGANNVNLYLDTVAVTGTSNQPASKTGGLFFSQQGNFGGNGYNGYMDDVRWYNRVLTPLEVITLYNKQGS